MNRTTAATHLSHARRHLREATLALLPPIPRRRLRALERQWREFIIETLRDAPGTADPEAPSSRSRRIDIEE